MDSSRITVLLGTVLGTQSRLVKYDEARDVSEYANVILAPFRPEAKERLFDFLCLQIGSIMRLSMKPFLRGELVKDNTVREHARNCAAGLFFQCENPLLQDDEIEGGFFDRRAGFVTTLFDLIFLELDTPPELEASLRHVATRIGHFFAEMAIILALACRSARPSFDVPGVTSLPPEAREGLAYEARSPRLLKLVMQKFLDTFDVEGKVIPAFGAYLGEILPLYESAGSEIVVKVSLRELLFPGVDVDPRTLRVIYGHLLDGIASSVRRFGASPVKLAVIRDIIAATGSSQIEGLYDPEALIEAARAKLAASAPSQRRDHHSSRR